MQRTTVEIVKNESRVIYVSKYGTQKANLSAKETLELVRKVLAAGGNMSDRGSFYIAPDGTEVNVRTTVLVEKGCKKPLYF